MQHQRISVIDIIGEPINEHEKEILKAYQELNEKCDSIITKIKVRKNKEHK